MKWFKSFLNTRPNAPPESTSGEGQNRRAPGGKDLPTVQGMFVCSGTYRDAAGLYLLDQHGQLAAELVRGSTAESIGHFAVSPDARWVAYTAYVRRQMDQTSYALIRALPAAGGTSQGLTHWDAHFEPHYQHPVFSPLGDMLACQLALGRPNNPNIEVLELFEYAGRLSGHTKLSIINPHSIGNHSPVFTPEGRRVVYFGNYAYEDMLEVCLYDPSTAQHELLGEVGWRLTENADGVWRRPRAIAFQPQWEQIFFIQGHMRSHERVCLILLSDIPPGAIVKHFDSIGGEHNRIGALEMSRDGLRLAFDADGAIYLIGTDGSGLRRVSKEGLDCRCPQLSKDGERIAFVADGQLCVTDCEGTGVETLANDELRVDEFYWA